MAYDTSSKALNANTSESSPAIVPSLRTSAGKVSMSVSRSHSLSNSDVTPPHVHAKNNGFSFPYTYQGTTYYTRPPTLPPLLPHEGWVPFYPMHHAMNNGYSVAQSHEYSHHYGNGYAQSFSSGYSNQYLTGYTIPHYDNNFHQHFYNYNCSNNLTLPTPYTNGNTISDLSTPFTNPMTQVHGISSGLIGQQNTPTRQGSLVSDNGQVRDSEWKKKKKNNKRNKRKKNSKNNEKKNDEPTNNGEEVDGSEGAPNEATGNQVHQNEKFNAHSDDERVCDNGDLDGQATSDDDVSSRIIGDDEAAGQAVSGIAVNQNGHVDAQIKSNDKADLSDQFNSDLFYECGESNDEVNGLNNGNDEQQRRR